MGDTTGNGSPELDVSGAPIDEATAYRLISQLTSDYAYSLAPTDEGVFELEWASPGFERVTGYTVEELRELGGWSVLVGPIEEEKKDHVVATLSSGADHTEDELKLVTKSGGSVWVRGFLKPIRNGDGGVVRVVGAVQDITEEKRAREALEAEVARSRLLSSVARASNTATSVEVALEVALEQVCLFTGWQVGHCLLVDESEDQALVSTGFWFQSDDADIEPFRAATRSIRFVDHVGLPGRVRQAGAFVSVPDLVPGPSLPRAEAAIRCGFRSAHGFPVLSGNEVLGVMEFFTFDVTQVDAELEGLMNTVGAQVGRVLERQRAAAALEESEERFRSVAETALDSIISADERGIIWYANPVTEDIFGYQPGELLGRPWTVIMPERFRGPHAAGLEALVRVGSDRAVGSIFHQVGLKKDGTEFPAEIALAYQRTSSGIVFTSMIRDVGERQRMEEELAKQRTRLEEAQFMAAMGSWEWEPATGTLLYSKGLLNMLGFPLDMELSFADLQRMVHPDDLEELLAISARVASGGGGRMLHTFRFTSPDGSTRLIETRAQVEADAQGGVSRIIAVDQDVTDRKRAERLLECQAEILHLVAVKEPLHGILERIACGIEREGQGVVCSILLAEDGVLRHGAAPSLPDAYNEAIEGIAIRDGVGSCGTAASLAQEVVVSDIENDSLWGDFAALAATHGLAACWSTPLFSKGDEVIGTFTLYYRSRREPSELDRKLVEVFSTLASVAIERDRADKTAAELEAHYRHAQKMQAVGQLAGGVAHDFNNLLQAMSTSAHLVAESLDPGDPRRGDVDTVLAASEKGTNLVRQLLSFARREPLAPTAVDLNASIENLGPLLRSTVGESIELELILAPGRVYAEIDPSSFEHVLLNLVTNARDATGRGGRISIETMTDVSDPGSAADNQVAVVVRDDGPGIDPQMQARVFEPFFTTKPPGEGSGLGLASVYGAAKAAGGSVHLSSVPGQGSEFWVYLPASRSRAQQPEVPPAPRPARPARGRPATILLAEDEGMVAESLRRVLTKRGYRVLTACDGIEALEAGLSDSIGIDLLVTDVVMPGLSGPELVRRLRAAGRSVRVLYMSGYSEETLDRRDLSLEADRYIGKPFGPDDLAAAVEGMLASVTGDRDELPGSHPYG